MVTGAVTIGQIVHKNNGLRPYFEPNNHEIPEADHAELKWRIAVPGSRVLDSNNVHKVENKFHCEEGHQEAECVGEHRADWNRSGAEVLW